MFFILLPSVALSQEAQTAYRVSAEDTITISVARHPEFSGDFLVPSDGVISIPAVGQTSVVGKTLVEVADCVASGLKSRLKEPEVTATLRSAGMQRVYVLGVVSKPGLYDLKPGWRITEAVAAAGGLAGQNEPNECKAIVLKFLNGKRETVEMQDVLRGAAEANLSIQSGDVITIESEETFPVYVMGKVKEPGLYRVRKTSAGIMEALTLAGGTLEGSALDRVAITHVDRSTQSVNLIPGVVSGKQGANVGLEAGDLIVVPEDMSRVAVLGYVNNPGFYPVRSGEELLLSDVLGMAGGLDKKRGQMDVVAVIRTENGKQTRMVCDLTKFLKTGDSANNPEIKAGDVVYVPQTKKPDWDFVARSLSAIGILMNPFIP
ncbi:MAG: SLBB domain-containing protein [Armatimonadota bacterium]